MNFIKIYHAQDFDYYYPDPALVEAIEAAFIKKDNLIKLQYLFYPPDEIQPNHVRLSIDDITVQNITNDTIVRKSAFIWDSKFIYNESFPIFDLYVFEEDKSYSKLLTFISSPTFSSMMKLFDRLSYVLYSNITFFQRHNNGDGSITLSIDSLETVPSASDFKKAMNLVVSWVSLLCHPIHPPKNLFCV